MNLFKNKLGYRPKKRMSERLFRRFAYKYYARNLLIDLQIEAKRETIAYIREHMRHCIIFEHRYDMLRDMLAQAPKSGQVLEFGVYDGGSIRAIAQWANRPVHGFDSFVGLPENWDGTTETRGKFNARGKLPKVPKSVTLHPGWFDETLPKFVEANNEPVALVHMDCDIYSSTKTVLDMLADRFQPGSIIVFDEYFNYNNWQQHEFRAFQEFTRDRRLKYEYLGFTAMECAVAVRILEFGAEPGPVTPVH